MPAVKFSETFVSGACFARDSQALFFRRFFLGQGVCTWKGEARERQNQNTERIALAARETL